MMHLTNMSEIQYQSSNVVSHREKFAMLFEQPVLLQANNVYLAWARISGPSSDCGSSGQMMVTTEDQ